MTVIEIVAERMIKKLEEAVNNNTAAPWQKSWNAVKMNYVTRRPYRGINLWLLPDDECEYITFKQFKELENKDGSLKLKDGTHTYPVIFWKMKDKSEIDDENDSSDDYAKIPFIMRYYKVIKISDVEGL